MTTRRTLEKMTKAQLVERVLELERAIRENPTLYKLPLEDVTPFHLQRQGTCWACIHGVCDKDYSHT